MKDLQLWNTCLRHFLCRLILTKLELKVRLQTACWNESEEIVKILLKNPKIQVNLAMQSKIPPLAIAAMIGNEKLRPQHQKLAQVVHAICNSSHLSPAQQQKIFDDVQTLLQNGGVPPDDATNVVNDIRTIATETK